MSTPIMTDAEGDQIPQHIADEMAALGALMQSPEAFDVVGGLVGPEHFHKPLHQVIYRAALDMRRRGLPVDAVTLSGELTAAPEWQRGPGAPYLHTLMQFAPTTSNAEHYAHGVVKAARFRMLQELGANLAAHGETGVQADRADAERIYESARLAMEQFESRMPQRKATSIAEAFQAVAAEAEAIQSGERRSIPTGFADLDFVTGGLLPGNLALVAARPGIGKSAGVLNLVANVGIRGGHRALVVSVEMSTLEIAQRMACAEAKVRVSDMREGRMTDDDWVRLARAMAKVDESPIDIISDPGMSLSAITSAIRAYKRQHPDLEVVAIDYIQRVRHDNPSGERRNDVLDISMAFTELAQSLGIAVVCAAQLNRNSAGTEPRLHDLKESGQLEQDAAVAILIHRPDAENRDDPRMGEADFIVAKNRFGPTSTVTVAHQLHYGRFVDMAPE